LIRLLADNEVSFDESQPAPEPKSWKSIEDDQQRIDDLTKENATLKQKLAESEAKYNEACQFVEGLKKRVEKLEEDLATSNDFVERMRIVVLSKNESLKSLTLERESAAVLKDKYIKVCTKKLYVSL